MLLTVRNAVPADTRGTARQGEGPRYDQRLVQILSNLVKNAIEASPEGGTVRIAIALSSQSAGSLTITVEDSGPGIAPELLPRLFTSFVTTKEGVGGVGGGHGLGLAISRELVLSLHGTLTLENRAAPATGCLATVTLPLT